MLSSEAGAGLDLPILKTMPIKIYTGGKLLTSLEVEPFETIREVQSGSILGFEWPWHMPDSQQQPVAATRSDPF